MKKLFLLLAAASCCFAQLNPVVLSQSTLTANVAVNNTAPVNISVPFPFVPSAPLNPGMLYVDSEAMNVVSASLDGMQLGVQRGALGTTAAAHAAGGLVFSGYPYQFVKTDKVGACDPNSPQYLNVTDQKYFTCTAGAWVSASTAGGGGGGGGTITGVTPGTGITGGGTSGNVPVALDTTVAATLNGTQTLNNKTIVSPALTGSPTLNGNAFGSLATQSAPNSAVLGSSAGGVPIDIAAAVRLSSGQSILRDFASAADAQYGGLVCDGSTDITSRLQTAIDNLLISSGLRGLSLVLPVSKNGLPCIISAPVLFRGNAENWILDLNGNVIRQITPNVPGLQFVSSDATPVNQHNWAIRNGWIQFLTPQTAGQTSGNCIQFGSAGTTVENDYFDWEISNMHFDGCYRGMTNMGGGTIWGGFAYNIWADGNMVGATMAYTSPGVSGLTRMKLLNFYNSQSANVEPVIRFNLPCQGCSAENIEANNTKGNVFEFGAWKGTLHNLHGESITCNANSQSFLEVGGATVSIDGIQINTNYTVNPGAGNTCYVVTTADGGVGFIDIKNVYVVPPTITSGSSILFSGVNVTSFNGSEWKLSNIDSQQQLYGTASGGGLVTFNAVGSWVAPAIGIATSSTNFSSVPAIVKGSCWHAGAPTPCSFNIKNAVGAGTDPANILTFSFNGGTSTGAHTYSMDGNLTAPSLTASGLTSGNCVQASTGGLLTTTGSACGAGGGGVTSGTLGARPTCASGTVGLYFATDQPPNQNLSNCSNATGTYQWVTNQLLTGGNLLINATTGALSTNGATVPTLASANLFTGVDSFPQIVFTGTPTIAVGPGAGTSPGTPTIMGNNFAHQIAFTTGTSPTVSSVIMTVTFSPTLSVAPKGCVLEAEGTNGANASNDKPAIFLGTPTTTGYTINANALGITASTATSWYAYCN